MADQELVQPVITKSELLEYFITPQNFAPNVGNMMSLFADEDIIKKKKAIINAWNGLLKKYDDYLTFDKSTYKLPIIGVKKLLNLRQIIIDFINYDPIDDDDGKLMEARLQEILKEIKKLDSDRFASVRRNVPSSGLGTYVYEFVQQITLLIDAFEGRTLEERNLLNLQGIRDGMNEAAQGNLNEIANNNLNVIQDNVNAIEGVINGIDQANITQKDINKLLEVLNLRLEGIANPFADITTRIDELLTQYHERLIRAESNRILGERVSLEEVTRSAVLELQQLLVDLNESIIRLRENINDGILKNMALLSTKPSDILTITTSVGDVLEGGINMNPNILSPNQIAYQQSRQLGKVFAASLFVGGAAALVYYTFPALEIYLWETFSTLKHPFTIESVNIALKKFGYGENMVELGANGSFIYNRQLEQGARITESSVDYALLQKSGGSGGGSETWNWVWTPVTKLTSYMSSTAKYILSLMATSFAATLSFIATIAAQTISKIPEITIGIITVGIALLGLFWSKKK